MSIHCSERDDRRLYMAGRMEAFYNKCNSPEDGRFCEGSDGPGRAPTGLSPRQQIAADAESAHAAVGAKAAVGYTLGDPIDSGNGRIKRIVEHQGKYIIIGMNDRKAKSNMSGHPSDTVAGAMAQIEGFKAAQGANSESNKRIQAAEAKYQEAMSHWNQIEADAKTAGYPHYDDQKTVVQNRAIRNEYVVKSTAKESKKVIEATQSAIDYVTTRAKERGETPSGALYDHYVSLLKKETKNLTKLERPTINAGGGVMDIMKFGGTPEGWEPEASELVLEDEEDVFELRREELGLRVIETFYNQDHNPDTGQFDVGADGPGRKRDNLKKTTKILGKHAPAWAHNLLSRRLGKARGKGAALLPAGAAQYQKELMARRMEESVTSPKRAGHSESVASAAPAKAALASPSKERKKEKSGLHPAGDYAYTPDGDMSSGWKLRLTSKPGGKPDRKTTAAAAQALSPAGFRGRPVQIPKADRAAVVARVREAWLAARPELGVEDLPESLKG